MPRFTDLSGLGGTVALLGAALLALPAVARLPRAWLATLLGAAAALALLPLGTLSAAGHVRGVIGDLSVTTTVLLLRALGRPFAGGGRAEDGGRLALQGLLALLSLVLYPLALGLGSSDPYRLGYGSPWLLTGLLLLALLFWLSRLDLPSLCLALAALGYACGWLESSNLWDYLLDPLVSIYAWGGLLLRGARHLLASAPGARAS
jgi:hypothetical protein